MLPQTSKISQLTNSPTEADQSVNNSDQQTLVMQRKSFKQVFNRLRIGQKIAYGYALAISIAILGTSIGLIAGDYFRKQALQQLSMAQQQQELLQNLQNAVFQARFHASRLPAVLGNSVWLKYEKYEFFKDIDQAKTLLLEVDAFIANHHRHLEYEPKKWQELFHKYVVTVNYFSQLIEQQIKEAEASNFNPYKLEAAQLKMLRTNHGESAIFLDQLSENLGEIFTKVDIQKRQALEAVEKAYALRFRIIIGSMLISIILAGRLAYHTSCAIAQPLEQVTKVAQRVTRESNFNLQAPVIAQDEVGILAIAFNELIQRVSEYTKELKQTQTQLIQTEKMSSLGQMVAGVAHEINNPVNFIKNNAEPAQAYIEDLLNLVALYQQRYPQPVAEIQELIEEIDLDFLRTDLPQTLASMKMGAERIGEIVVSMRNFSRLDGSQMQRVDIHEGVDSTLIILNHRLKQGINVVKKYGNLPLIECYPAQLNQVFMNIISNSIDALEDAKNIDSPILSISTEVIDENAVAIKIGDNGEGILPALQENIFEPFFTTKSIGKGTGLGLAISSQIIGKHQGTIKVNSAPNQGTEFVITLPIKAS